MRARRRFCPTAVATAVIATVVLAGACSSSDDSSSPTTDRATATVSTVATTTAVSGSGSGELTVLVTNDDGVGAPGIDTLVQALRGVPDTKVIVAAPAQNRSGSGGRTTPGGAPAAPATTASGFPATAVSGFPADSVNWALDPGGIGVTPDVVISGINQGQNIGKLVDSSGTVGAARAAGARGVPALAVSQGIAEQPDFPTSAALALDWLKEHRADLLSGKLATTKPAPVENLNVPTCTAGKVKGVIEVPVDTVTEVQVAPVDCSVGGAKPADDVAAFNAGYAPLSVLTVPAAAGG
jgi:5'-nucleotidase